MPTVASLSDRPAYQDCTTCGTGLPVTEQNFFHRTQPNGRVWIDSRCQSCRIERDRETRRLRAAGTPVRAAAAGNGTAIFQVDNRKFGVEIEFNRISTYDAREALRDAGISLYEDREYTHRVTSQWKIVSDGSLSNGGEAVSPPLKGAGGLEQVKQIVTILKAAGAIVTGQAGLHVHHDISDLSAEQLGLLARAWFNAQDAIDNLVAASRRYGNSTWCQRLREREVEIVEALPTNDRDSYQVRGLDSINRYRTLNFAAFPKYGTVEMRQHQGSLNARKIAAWVAFGKAFITAAKAGHVERPYDTDQLIMRLQEHGNLDERTATFLRARVANFTGANQYAVAA